MSPGNGERDNGAPRRSRGGVWCRVPCPGVAVADRRGRTTPGSVGGRFALRRMIARVGASVSVLAVTLTLTVGSAPARATNEVVAGTHFVSAAPYTSPTCSTSNGDDFEASVATDPTNGHLVAAWLQNIQGLGDPGGAPLDTIAAVTAASSDGGATWSSATTPAGGMVCATPPGPGDATNDPSLAIGPDGRRYLGRVELTCDPTGNCPQARVDVTTSTDGTTWAMPVPMADDGADSVDTVVADPLQAGRAYVAWYTCAGVPVAGRTAPLTCLDLVATTADGGSTWSTPATVHVPPAGMLDADSRLVVLSDGSLLDVFPETPATVSPADTVLYATRSTDHGTNWTPPVRIGDKPLTAVVDPQTGATIGVDCCTLAVAAGPGETAALAWTTTTGPDAGDVWVATTTDGGAEWRAPADIHRPGQVVAPAIAANRTGLAVLWYELSKQPSPDELPTRVFAATTADGGENWTTIALSAPFDLRSEPTFNGDETLSNYQGLTATQNGFQAAFAVARPLAKNGASDIMTAAIPAP
jgi:hypothetical protein